MDLSKIKKASAYDVNRGTLTTIFGDPGVGKTTFAASCWPNPLIIPIEWGLRSTPWVSTTGQPKRTEEVFDAVEGFGIGVKEGTLDFKTLVFDSMSKFDAMLAAELCEKAKVDSLSKYGGGYGAGPDALKGKHQMLREYVERLLNRGIHIVVISHIESRAIKPPTGDAYDQWTLQMTKGGREQWINQTDAVIHLKMPMVVHKVPGESRKVASDTGSHRLIDMTPSAATVAKNRFNVEEEIVFKLNMDSDGKVSENPVIDNPIAHLYGFPQEVKQDG